MDFDSTKYKKFKLPHPMLLHWIINPGIAFNELLLGQRIPKLTLIDKTNDAPLTERQYVPCPHCHTLHNSRRWSGSNATGHWFGLICPTCEGRIPCLWNITSLALLVITYPFWFAFKDELERRWLANAKKRAALIGDLPAPDDEKASWLKIGLFWGGTMFCIMELPRILREPFHWQNELPTVGIWLAGGLLFGWAMKLISGRKGKASSQ